MRRNVLWPTGALLAGALIFWAAAWSKPPRARVVCPPRATVGSEKVCVCVVRGLDKAASVDFRYVWRIDGHEDTYDEEYGMIIVRWARPGLRAVSCDVWYGRRYIGRAEATVEVVAP